MELALCVAVIGVLTAFLLPRVADWKAEGRSIQLINAMASVNKAVVIFQAECSRKPDRQCAGLEAFGGGSALLHQCSVLLRHFFQRSHRPVVQIMPAIPNPA